LLSSDSELLPCQAAERISLNRLTAREKQRTAKDIMEPMSTLGIQATLTEAATLIVRSQSHIVGVLSLDDRLAGVITTWDITQAAAEGGVEDRVEKIMTRKVISADPTDSILDIVTNLEQNQISAMPVVENGTVLGMVSSDLLAQRYLLRLLRSHTKMS
jgi:CBS domain-containing protein